MAKYIVSASKIEKLKSEIPAIALLTQNSTKTSLWWRNDGVAAGEVGPELTLPHPHMHERQFIQDCLATIREV